MDHLSQKRLQRPLLRAFIASGGILALSVLLLLPRASTAATAAATQSGAQLYVDSGCTQCHGIAGTGTEKGPNLHDVRKRLNSDQVHHQIKDGGKSMPAFVGALNDPQIDELVAFLRSKPAWKKPLPTPTTTK